MGLVAVILDPAVAAKIVRHLGLAPRAPPRLATVAPSVAAAVGIESATALGLDG